jgi:DNA invertase Pin-like site-specific DNA recombinase
MRTVIYTRYSADIMSPQSNTDQERICRARAEREGWTVVEVVHDRAISGANLHRPGYQALLQAMRAGRVEVVLAESLDRISRDQEHVAAFYKQAQFSGVRVVTLTEGEVTELHVGLRGTMGALFLKDLADKTRRGMQGVILSGRSAGSVTYGYRVRRELDADGEPKRGLRDVDPVHAPIVRRIYVEYAGGRSPRAIAKSLNEERIPGPAGGPWFASTILGRAGRGDGILRNPIYVGRRVWNKKRNFKEPTTGRTVRRRNEPTAYVTQDVPELRIVDDELWGRVQARLVAEAARPTQDAAKPSAFWEARRPQHLLTGKVTCGVCGGLYYARGRDYLSCHNARRDQCRNRASVRRAPLEARVMEALGRQLMHPDLLRQFISDFTREWNRLAAEAGQAQSTQRQALEAVERQIANLVDAIAEGLRAPGLQAKLDGLEAQRVTLTAELTKRPANLPALHPNLADVYRERVARLEQALADRDAPEALEAARALIDRVIVSPPSDPGSPPGIELVGQLQAMLCAGGADIGTKDRRSANAVLSLFDSAVKAGPGGQRPPCVTPHAAGARRVPPRSSSVVTITTFAAFHATPFMKAAA